MNSLENGISIILKYRTLKPLKDYHEDNGVVLWWHLPIQEPPHIGTPEEWDKFGNPTDTMQLINNGWLTHWTPILEPNRVDDNKEY